MKKTAAVLLFLAILPASLSFAAGWQEVSAVAIFIAAMLLGLIFAIGYAIESQELKFLARDEMLQLVVTALLAGVFVAILGTLFSGIQAQGVNDANETLVIIDGINTKLGAVAMTLGAAGGKSIWCSFSAAGFGVSPCGGFRMLAPAVSAAFQTTAMAIAELSGIIALMNFANTWIFTLFFPIGLFLRTFKYTRGAGSLFISVGVAAYLFLPLAYVTIHDLVKSSAAFVTGNSYGAPELSVGADCDPYDIEGTTNENSAISAFSSLRAGISNILFYVLIDATLTTVVSLAVMVASIRYIAHMAGAEVDVQALGRLI